MKDSRQWSRFLVLFSSFLLLRFVYATLLGKCLRESIVEHFGEESDSLEISEEGCGCQSCEMYSTVSKVSITDEVLLLLNTIRMLNRSDRTEKKVCVI